MEKIMQLLTFAIDSSVQTYIFLGIIVLAFGGLMVFSSFRQKKQRAQMTEMASKLGPGDKVKTIGGIIGEIVEVNHVEGTITISTGTSTMVFDKQAVYSFGYFDKPGANQNVHESQSISESEAKSVYENEVQNIDESVTQKQKSKRSKSQNIDDNNSF